MEIPRFTQHTEPYAHVSFVTEKRIHRLYHWIKSSMFNPHVILGRDDFLDKIMTRDISTKSLEYFKTRTIYI